MGSKVTYGQLVGTFNGLNWTFMVSVRAYRRPKGNYRVAATFWDTKVSLFVVNWYVKIKM